MSDDAMAHPPKSRTQTGRTQLARQQRHARLAAELRSNLRKRKAQARTRVPQDASLDASPGAFPGAQGDDRRPDPSGAPEAATRPRGETA
jgi:hypothetical protein